MKDLNKFLSEKEEDKKKPHAVKEGEGADDKRFLLMMEEYKRVRRTDKEEAAKLFEKIMKLNKSGDVSAKAKLAAAYI